MYYLFVGLISGQIVLPLAIWIAIQVGYTFLAVRTPFLFKRLTVNKKRKCILHVVSLLIGVFSLIIPSVLIFSLTGYGLVDTIFPPIICIATNRDINVYVVLIPVGVLSAMIITMLVLILHYLVRYIVKTIMIEYMTEAPDHVPPGTDPLVLTPYSVYYKVL